MDPVLKESRTHLWQVKPSESVMPFMSRVPHGPGAQRGWHALDAGEASCRSLLPFTFWVPHGLGPQREWCSMRVKPVAAAYCRPQPGCHIELVLRDNGMCSMLVKSVDETNCRLCSGCDMDTVLREGHALDAGVAICRSILPVRFRVPHGPGAQREQLALVVGEYNGRSVSPFAFRGPYGPSAQRAARARCG
ncbi:hypothetical protein MRX96_017406 [Rhipicephalus microplus]